MRATGSPNAGAVMPVGVGQLALTPEYTVITGSMVPVQVVVLVPGLTVIRALRA